MPVNINYSPAAAPVAAAGFQAGLGDYSRWASSLALQNKQLDQQKLLAQQQMQVSEWQTQYGAASDQFMQAQGINSQQTMQVRDLTNQEYLQQNSLSNQRLMQLNDLANQQYLSQQHIAAQASSQAYGTQANLQSQMLAGNIHSALQGQAANDALGLSSQNFDQQAMLENQQAQQRMQINRAHIQDQLDFIPQMSEAEYQAAQQQFANKFQALTAAGPPELGGNGTLTPDEFNQARQDLMGQQLGLKQRMPARTDFATSFAKNSYTDPNMTVPDGNGGAIPMRYVRNQQTGEITLDPAMPQIINNARYTAANASKLRQTQAAFVANTSSAVMTYAAKIMAADTTGRITPQIALQQAQAMIVSANKFSANLFDPQAMAPEPDPSMYDTAGAY